MSRSLCLCLVMIGTACAADPADPVDVGTDAGASDNGVFDADLPDAHSEDAEVDAGFPDLGLVDAGSDGGADLGPGDLGPAYLTTLDDPLALEGLLGPAGDVKYLAPVTGAPPEVLTEPCYFQNMAIFPFHLLFLRSFPGLENLSNSEYVTRVLRRPTRIWWGGGLKRYPATPHPGGGQGVIAWAVYHENAGADRLTGDDLLAVQVILQSCVSFAPAELAFLPTDPFQNSFVRAERAALLARGVPVILPEELR
ncbi:MAG: hypothetical protein IPG45_03460 [Deltaproteobacteria bacterium]|nr:hypothetical protein [Deltaproteobacteria bacterium]